VYGGFGSRLKYNPLVRGKGDEKKPELIRVLTVHPDLPGRDLECSIDVALLPLPENVRDAKEYAEDEISRAYRSVGNVRQYTALSYSVGLLTVGTILVQLTALVGRSEAQQENPHSAARQKGEITARCDAKSESGSRAASGYQSGADILGGRCVYGPG
jgi:hypothetical protein